MSSDRGRARQLLGLSLVVVVVFLWVGSSALIQGIFDSFDEPFFLTYFSTSLFVLWLPVVWLRRRCCAGMEASPVGDSVPLVPSRHQTPPRGDEVVYSEDSDGCEQQKRRTVREHVRVALVLCPLWFALNYTFNYSLSRTTLASNTILSTTSGVWTLLLSLVVLKEPFHWVNALGVGCTVAGSVCVGLNAPRSDNEDEEDTFWGVFWCFVSAICYAIYSIVLSVRVDEEVMDVQMLFGLIGGINLVTLWPGFFLLAAAGVEALAAPSLSVVGWLCLNGLLGTVVSDYLWARSVLLISPLVATLGLTLTIPVAMLVDAVWNGTRYNAVYVVGGMFMVSGFVLVNWRYSARLQEEEEEEKVDPVE